jgi:hypothetical protein
MQPRCNRDATTTCTFSSKALCLTTIYITELSAAAQAIFAMQRPFCNATSLALKLWPVVGRIFFTATQRYARR